MDSLLGENTCKRFRETWLKYVPFVIAAAKCTNTRSVTSLLNSYKDLNDDFGNETLFLF